MSLAARASSLSSKSWLGTRSVRGVVARFLYSHANTAEVRLSTSFSHIKGSSSAASHHRRCDPKQSWQTWFPHVPQHFTQFRWLRSAMAANAKWNYDNQSEWAHLPGSQATGNRQSPIHIQTTEVVRNETLEPLKLTGWEAPISGSFCNNGRSVQFDLAPQQSPATIQNHRGVYEAQQFHFHWGECHGTGSEHLVDGKQYDSELHVVHKKVGGTDGAHDAFTVLGVFCIEDSTMDDSTGIWKQLTVPRNYNKTLQVEGIRLVDLLPSNLDYYYYEGSLTTPPCSEVVQWFVFKEPIRVPKSFLDSLRAIEHEDNGQLCRNFRELQQLNARKVETPASANA